MFVCSNEKNYLFLCLRLFVDYWEKKSIRNQSLPNSSSILEGTRAWYARVPQKKKKRALYSSFVFTKNSNLVSLVLCCMELKFTMLEFHVAFFPQKNPRQHKFFIFIFMNLECLKLDLHSKLEFHELEFQKVVLLLFCKQWYVANNFCEKW